LLKSDQSGVTEREHLEQVEKQTGIRPKGLDGPTLPFLLSHLWSAFLHLNSSRSSGMSSNPITFQEIKAWAELTSTPLNPTDVEIIKRLDTLYIRSA